METKVLKSTEDTIALGAKLLNDGEIVAFPTETVYGLGAKVFDEQAIQKIFDVKGRPSDNPLIVHISALSQVDMLATDVPQVFYDLADAFFPGPLTLVVHKKDTVPAIASANLPTIGIRMPHHPVALKLIDAVGVPLVAPSANLSGRPSPTEAQYVLQDLQNKIPLIIDGGPCDVGIESTVLDLTVTPYTILRPGHITHEQLEKALGGMPILGSSSADTPTVAKAPGMKYRHYAPNATIVLAETLEMFATFMQTHTPQDTWIMTNAHLPIGAASFTTIPLQEKTLYKTFRDADHTNISTIIIVLDETIKKNKGLLNRIEKASKK